MAATGRPDRAADQRSVRSHNLALALRAVSGADAPVSRADIATATGMTRATASSLVESLLAAGFVAELAPRSGPRGGRPATGLVLRDSGPAVLGLEIGVGAVEACLLRLTGAVAFRASAPRPRATDPTAEPEAAVAALGALTRRARVTAESGGMPVAGAALAVPGLLSRDATLRLAPNLGWRDVDVRALLAAEPALADLAVTVDNEADLAALGELSTLAADASFLLVSGGIGVGAGVVVDGGLYRGRHGWGGEIGHVCVEPSGPRCTCGARGCLEQYAGQGALLAAAGLAAAADGAGVVPGADGAGGLSRLVAAAQAGDSAALTALARAGSALGVAVAGALNLLDLDQVVLGGTYATLFDWVAPEVERETRDRVLSWQWAPTVVRRSGLGADAAVVGAARSVLASVLSAPDQVVVRG